MFHPLPRTLQAKTVVGSPYYLSPEVCEGRSYDEHSDVWALGCILYELCALQHAFSSSNLLGVVYKIVEERPPPPPAHYSAELRGLIEQLLCKDPGRRPLACDLLEHPLLAGRVERIAEREGWNVGTPSPRLARKPTAGPAEVRGLKLAHSLIFLRPFLWLSLTLSSCAPSTGSRSASRSMLLLLLTGGRRKAT